MLKTPAQYRPGLDVIRLAALLPVLCYHFCIEAARLGFAVPAILVGRGMADWVEIGLAWFFLLSGAALCLQWQGRFRWRPYLVGRAAAMYPAFWLGFAVLFIYGEILHGNNAQIPRWRVIFSVLGVDGYLAPVTPTFYKIGEWFLGVILLLYLVFPLLLWCMDRPLRRRILLTALVALQLLWPALCPAPRSMGTGSLPAAVGPRRSPAGRLADDFRPAVLGSLRPWAAVAPAVLEAASPPRRLVLRCLPCTSCAADAGTAARRNPVGLAAAGLAAGFLPCQFCAGRSADGTGCAFRPSDQTGRLNQQKTTDADSIRGFLVFHHKFFQRQFPKRRVGLRPLAQTPKGILRQGFEGGQCDFHTLRQAFSFPDPYHTAIL